MKNYFLLFTAILACLSISSCKGEDSIGLDVGTVRSPNYVDLYVVVDDFDITQRDKNTLSISFTGKEIRSRSDDFEALAKSFNDVSYPYYILPGNSSSISEPLSQVNIVSNKDFDENHKAGQSLNDIVLLRSSSPYDYIKSGYKDVVDQRDYPDYWHNWRLQHGGIGYKLVEMYLNGITVRNTKMLYPFCLLFFTKNTTNQGEHTFTVSVKIGDKEIIKDITCLL